MQQENKNEVRFGKFTSRINRLSGWLECVGVFGALALLLITWVDVVGAKLFTLPLPGAYELTRFSQLVAIAFVVAIAQVVGRHISIDFFLVRLPKWPRGIINCLIPLLLLVFFIGATLQIFRYGWSVQIAGQVGSTLPIPFYPFIYGLAFAFIFVCLVFLSEFLQSLALVIKK